MLSQMKRGSFTYQSMHAMRIGLLFLLCVGLNSGLNGLAAEEDSSFQPERVSFLIELLASKNSRPQQVHRDIDFPKNYQYEAQVPVYLAMRQLLNEGAGACDGLCKHFEDQRYSYTKKGINGDTNRSVGSVSNEIFQCILCPYHYEIHFITRDQRNIGLGAEKDLKDWWKTHREQPLWQLQLEQIELALKFFSTARTETVASIHPDAPRFDTEEFEKLRIENVEHLQALKTSINALKKPYVTQLIESGGSSQTGFTSLPWTNAAKHNRPNTVPLPE